MHRRVHAVLLALLALAALAALALRVPRMLSSCEAFGQEAKLYITMTTSPLRIHQMAPVVEAIMRQTVPPAKIILHLPHVFKRSGEHFGALPGFLTSNERVHINWCEDVGPATKVLPCMGLDWIRGGDMLLSMDDDIQVPPDFAESFQRYALAYPDAVITGCSAYVTDQRPAGSRADLPVRRAEMVEGFSGVLYRKRFLEGFDMATITGAGPACMRGDDLTLSNHLAKRGVPVYLMQDPFCIPRITPLPYGEGADALHLSSDNPHYSGHNYDGCKAALQADAKFHLTHSHMWPR